ncbi:MAG: hypothetical protein WC497_05990 [Patescibacteria group bacterium]
MPDPESTHEELAPLYRPSDFVERDFNLLLLLIICELAESKREEFYLSEFIKGNLISTEDVVSELQDTDDYESLEEMVLGQLLFVLEDLRLAKVENVGIDDTSRAMDSLAKFIHEADWSEPKSEEGYGYLIAKYAKLHGEAESAREKRVKKVGVDEWFRQPANAVTALPLYYTPSSYHKHLGAAISCTPDRIVVRAKFDSSRVGDIREEIARYMNFFSSRDGNGKRADAFPYGNVRPCFTKQIENFYNYLAKLPQVGNVIHVPFSALGEDGFEVVKLMRHLQESGAATLSWSDADFWRVTFAKTPITISLLLGEVNVVQDALIAVSRKGILEFNYDTGELTLDNKKIKIQGSDQKELLRIIFSDRKRLGKAWFYSEIAETFDRADNLDDKKFYNAAYQVNQKIIKSVAINDFLITTSQTVTVNPKYVPQT